MNNKGLLVLIFATFITGTVFAQTEEAQEETPSEAQETTEALIADQLETDQADGKNKMPKNTITIDIGPLITGAIVSTFTGQMENMTGGGDDVAMPSSSSSSFGFAVQYERQISDRFGTGGRFSYMESNMHMKSGFGDDITAALNIGYYSFSVEGHVRFYPWAKVFFLDGILGYARLAAALSGNFNSSSTRKSESAKIDLQRDYFKLGGKLGWRIDFGKPGGFVLEPSLGFAWGIGMGNSILKQFGQKSTSILDEPVKIDQTMDILSTVMEQFLIDAGPSFALTFGWRF
jgi:opacity protein-like surface antigen